MVIWFLVNGGLTHGSVGFHVRQSGRRPVKPPFGSAGAHVPPRCRNLVGAFQQIRAGPARTFSTNLMSFGRRLFVTLKVRTLLGLGGA